MTPDPKETSTARPVCPACGQAEGVVDSISDISEGISNTLYMTVPHPRATCAKALDLGSDRTTLCISNIQILQENLIKAAHPL